MVTSHGRIPVIDPVRAIEGENGWRRLAAACNRGGSDLLHEPGFLVIFDGTRMDRG